MPDRTTFGSYPISQEAAWEMKQAIEMVLAADGDLAAMDFVQLRAALALAETGCGPQAAG